MAFQEINGRFEATFSYGNGFITASLSESAVLVYASIFGCHGQDVAAVLNDNVKIIEEIFLGYANKHKIPAGQTIQYNGPNDTKLNEWDNR